MSDGPRGSRPGPGRRGLLRLGVAAAGASLYPTGLRAAGVEVAPVITELLPTQMTSTVQLSNRNPTPISLQARAYDWQHNATNDSLTETDALLVSPPIFQIPPGHTQILRLMLRRPPQQAEGAHRILVDEIPAGGGVAGQIQLALRLSLPVFAYSQTVLRPVLRWSLTPGGLLVENAGTRHARLNEVTLTDRQGRRYPLEAPETPYVLAGRQRQWLLARAPQGGALRVSGTTEAGPFETDLTLSSR